MTLQGRKLVSAASMAFAVEHDPQFQLPVKPHFPNDVVVVRLPDGLLVEGAGERQVFRGQSALGLLPKLLPLLDGTRTVAEAAELLPDTSEEGIRQAVALLYTRGLLEDGATGEEADLQAVPEEVAAFLRRHIDTTRVNRSASEAAHRLRTANLAIIGHTAQTSQLAAHLRSIGVDDVHLGAPGAPLPPEDFTLLVVLMSGSMEQSWVRELDDTCARRSLPWLRTAFHGDSIEIGPYFDRKSTPCYRCFERLHQADVYDSEHVTTREQVWLSMAATEIAYLISRMMPAITAQDMVRFHFNDWSQARSRYAKVPGCPVCVPGVPEATGTMPMAYAYEQSVLFPPRALLNPKDHQHHYKVTNLDLQHDEKRYPSAPVIALQRPGQTPTPQGDYGSGIFPTPTCGLNQRTLAGLLLRTAGLRSSAAALAAGKVQRWAPTGGNLGSVQAYVLPLRVDGVAPGYYLYGPGSHTLTCLPGAPTQAELSTVARKALGELPDADCAAIVVLTGAYLRVGHKYGPFAYRILNLDAGVATAQFQAVADGYGLGALVHSRWADSVLLEALGLDGDSEPITAVISICDGRGHHGQDI